MEIEIIMSLCNLGTTKAEKDYPVARSQDTNPFLNPDETLCEYHDDIWKTLLQQEAEKPIIHLQSPQLKFRGALVVLLRDVTRKLGLNIGTLHSAVCYLDSFMDKHRLREDRLIHVALACLSLATKNEERLRTPYIQTLSLASGTTLCPKTFKQMEWMIGEHRNWRLLAPTPVTFAALLAQHVVSDRDPISRNPAFLYKYKRDGARILEKYLDLSLSNYRLTVVNSVNVACACLACARTDLGLCAWPAWLAAVAGREWPRLASVVRLLQGMMERVKACAKLNKSHQNTVGISELSTTEIAGSVTERISSPTAPAYTKIRSADPLLASTSVPVKRGSDLPMEVDNKRCCLSIQSQIQANQSERERHAHAVFIYEESARNENMMTWSDRRQILISRASCRTLVHSDKSECSRGSIN